MTDLDRLFRAGVEAAGRALAERGETWPFALGVTVDGDLVSPQVQPATARPDVAAVVVVVPYALPGPELGQPVRAAGRRQVF